ncbi:TonB-dependent receptor plug domain-containing protein [Caulobacter segnis]
MRAAGLRRGHGDVPADGRPPRGLKPPRIKTALSRKSSSSVSARPSSRPRTLKKNSEEIVDSITAVDIGGLPDRSVTEALQRVPGVTIGRTNQPRDVDRLNAEGSGIQIRGLTWVRSELNGRDMFSAKGGRAISWEDVTPELFAGVDVYKNPRPTSSKAVWAARSICARACRSTRPAARWPSRPTHTRGDLRKAGTPSGSLLLSDRFQTNWGEFGALLSVSNSKLKTAVNTIAVDLYNAHGVGVQSS